MKKEDTDVLRVLADELEDKGDPRCELVREAAAIGECQRRMEEIGEKLLKGLNKRFIEQVSQRRVAIIRQAQTDLQKLQRRIVDA